MSNILIVEPHKVLQQALVVALFPEHRVQVIEEIGEEKSAMEADVIIIDGGALRTRNLLTDEGLSTVRSWCVPIIWIDSEALGEAAAPKLVHLTAPLKREELRAAVEGCLQSSSAAPAAVLSAADPVAAVTAKPEAAEPSSAVDADEEKEVIELVDVFDEASSPAHDNADARNRD